MKIEDELDRDLLGEPELLRDVLWELELLRDLQEVGRGFVSHRAAMGESKG